MFVVRVGGLKNKSKLTSQSNKQTKQKFLFFFTPNINYPFLLTPDTQQHYTTRQKNAKQQRTDTLRWEATTARV
jgi:hypothetical protein